MTMTMAMTKAFGHNGSDGSPKGLTMTMTMTMTMTNDNNYGFRFRDWNVYNDAREFRREVNDLLKTFPREEKYALVDQAKRALNSIILNIAESANKNTDKDMRVYINRAHCSLDEVVACLDCALDDKYINEEQLKEKSHKASSLAKRLRAFNNKLATKN